jgi:hypothetical protein
VPRKNPELRPVMVRLPEKLRRNLEQLAHFYSRSMNAEIIYRLERSIAEDRERRQRKRGLPGLIELAETEEGSPPHLVLSVGGKRYRFKIDNVVEEIDKKESES